MDEITDALSAMPPEGSFIIAYWRVLKMSRTLKNQQLYIQEEHNMFINPSPLIPLPSVSFQCKTFRTMLVRGKMFAGGGGRPRLQMNHPLPAD